MTDVSKEKREATCHLCGGEIREWSHRVHLAALGLHDKSAHDKCWRIYRAGYLQDHVDIQGRVEKCVKETMDEVLDSYLPSCVRREVKDLCEEEEETRKLLRKSIDDYVRDAVRVLVPAGVRNTLELMLAEEKKEPAVSESEPQPRAVAAANERLAPERARLCNEKQAARYLGMSVSFLQTDRGKKKRQIPFVKIGSAVRYDPADLDVFLKRARRRS